MAFSRNAEKNKCFLKNKDHRAESAHAYSTSARMSCYEGRHLPQTNTVTLYYIMPMFLEFKIQIPGLDYCFLLNE